MAAPIYIPTNTVGKFHFEIFFFKSQQYNLDFPYQ